MSANDISFGVNDEQFDNILAQVLTETEFVNNQVEDLEQEAREVEATAKQIVRESKASFQQVILAARKTIRVIISIAVASGQAFDQVFLLGIEAALTIAEVIADLATAEAITTGNLVGAGLKLALAAALVAQARQLEQGRRDNAARLGGLVQGLSVLTYMGLPLWMIYATCLILKYIGAFE